MCHLRCYTRNHGNDKIIDLVRYRRQKAVERLPATGTDGMVDRTEIKKKRTEFQKEMGPYWEKLQASIGGFTTKKTLAIRNRLNEI